MNKNSRIYIAGGTGMVGYAIGRNLQNKGYKNLWCGTRADGDLEDQEVVINIFDNFEPEYVFLCAAKVGGIYANDHYPADFIRSNLTIQSNIIETSYMKKVKKLLFLGSSCIYPKYAEQPISEDALLDGKLEPTNEAYAIAKIAGIKMCQAYNKQYGTNYISCMPTNLYGPNDSYDLETCHVLPALIRKVHEAKTKKSPFIELWGSGAPLREFLYVEDMAEACVFLMNKYNSSEIINIGSGIEISIFELTLLITSIIQYSGEISHCEDMPNGMMRKALDSSKINDLGWKATTSLEDGIKLAYNDFLTNI